MSVYVDPMSKVLMPNKNWPYKTSCHMIADTVKELKSFAVEVSLHPSWYQPKSFPHFDLTEGKRILAVDLGAIELPIREFVYKMREIRENE